mgnify:CR=1 FL=1
MRNRPDHRHAPFLPSGSTETLSLAKYRRDVDLLQQDLQRQGCPLQLKAGMELFATEELSGLLERQEFLTLADSRYLLVEFFFDEDAGFMEESLQQIWSMALLLSWLIPSVIMQCRKSRISPRHGFYRAVFCS